MRTFSYINDDESLRAEDRIEVIGLVCESRAFRIYKASKGSKYVILKSPVSPDAMTLEMLRREYELSCDLNHPSLARTIGFEPGTPVGPAILIEYVDGVGLDDFLAGHPSRSRRKAVLQDILEGVDYLHHRGVIHNDLKPDNIIVTRTGAARIIDFGLSASSDSIYRGCLGGTDGYTAPEILRRGESAGPASDIYSVGKLIELLFEGRGYRRIVQRCIDPDPLARPQQIRTLQRLIRARDRMPFVWGASVAALLVVGLLVLLFVRQRVGMEDRIDERVVSYSEERADLLDSEKRQRVEALRRSYEADLGPACNQVLAQIDGQSCREVAQLFTIPYYELSIPYMDSICRCFPMLPDGTVPVQTVLIGQLFNEYRQRIDSALNRLPSIDSFPSSQRDSLLLVIERLSEQVQRRN